MKRIVILPDDIDEIAAEVRVLCSGFTYVFTCGGVGPTHDDITFEAIAKAFEEELVIDPEIKRVLEKYYKGDDLKTALKMAKVHSNYAFFLQLGQILFEEVFRTLPRVLVKYLLSFDKKFDTRMTYNRI